MSQPIAQTGAFPGFVSALIVDDHPLFCDALALTLTGPAGIATVDTARTLDAAIQHISQKGAPDVVVLDLNLPDVEGLDGVTKMRALDADLPIIVVSSLTDLRVVRASLQAGATAFLPKHAEREEICEAFVTISRGGAHSSRKVLDSSTVTPSEEAQARLAQLTRQQASILQLVCAGLMNKQIAYEMSIAETTVKAHVTAIMRKLGVQSRMQAVLLAQQASLSAFSKEG